MLSLIGALCRSTLTFNLSRTGKHCLKYIVSIFNSFRKGARRDCRGRNSIYVTAIRPQHDIGWFVNDLFLGTPVYRTQIVSLSLIADAFLFFLFDRMRQMNAMRGVIIAMLVYALYVVPAIIFEQLVKHGWL